jgi:hypothetical protein
MEQRFDETNVAGSLLIGKHWATLAQVDMESMFLFAKLLLDRSAYALQYYFGPIDGSGKKPLGGALMKVKTWNNYVAAKRLAQTAPFKIAAADVYCVAKFRDDQIAHESDTKTCRGGVTCTEDGLSLGFGLFYPKPGDKQHPHSLTAKDVLAKLHTYFTAFIGLISANKDKTVLRVATTT